MAAKILVFPRDPNPYQELLYAPMRQQGDDITYLKGPSKSHTLNLILIPGTLFLYKVLGFHTFHLHWTYPFHLPFGGFIGRALMRQYFSLFIRWVKFLDFKLVWTAHNALPHAKLFNNDRRASLFLGKHSDVVIAHSTAGKRQLTDLGIPAGKITIIPHGNYQRVYPNTVSRSEARKQLNVTRDAFLVIFTGIIDTYKNVPGLLAAAAELHRDYPQLKVIVAGTCKSHSLREQLQDYQERLGNQLELHLGFVNNDKLQLYFNAADVTATPFSSVTTSGSVLLSLTFGTPIIAPRLGALKDMPLSVGFFYVPGQKDGLRKALLRAIQAPTLADRRTAAQQYAASLDWQLIAAKTQGVLKIRHRHDAKN